MRAIINSFSSRDLAEVASLIATVRRSTSAPADFMFWPETANCSVSAAIRASDSLSLARAESKVDCLFSTSVTALEISNFKRSLLWLISSSFAPRSATSAEISMSEREEAEPPRARCDANTSPSRVTTVTVLCWRKMPSASAALSATTVVDSSDVRSSEI